MSSPSREKVKLLVFGTLAYLLLRGLRCCVRCKTGRLPAQVQEGASFQEPCIFVFWHNRQIALPWYFQMFRPHLSRKISVLISRHFDGRLIAWVIQRFGIASIAGSSSRGAVPATKALLAELHAGNNIAITPDGPRGPIYVAKSGAANISKETGVPIYPVAFAAKSSWVFQSWDRMFLPKPFSEVRLFVAEAVLPVQEEAVDCYAQRVEEALRKITEEADAYFVKDRL